jgi:hypothetical protein
VESVTSECGARSDRKRHAVPSGSLIMEWHIRYLIWITSFPMVDRTGRPKCPRTGNLGPLSITNLILSELELEHMVEQVSKEVTLTFI